MRYLPLLLLLLACAPDLQTRRQTELDNYRRELIATGDVNDAAPAGRHYIRLAERYARAYPADTLSAHYLFVAADVARGLRRYEQALDLWERVGAQSAYSRAPEALFLQGFTAETGLRDPVRAAMYSREFLQRYPDHELTGQVRQLLSLL